jgi:hypothetical protein
MKLSALTFGAYMLATVEDFTWGGGRANSAVSSVPVMENWGTQVLCLQVSVLSDATLVEDSAPLSQVGARAGILNCFLIYSVTCLFHHIFQLSCPPFMVFSALPIFCSAECSLSFVTEERLCLLVRRVQQRKILLLHNLFLQVPTLYCPNLVEFAVNHY